MKTRLTIAILLISVLFAITAGAENAAVELDATDVNCRDCHADPHIIHSEKNLVCQNCHGTNLDVKIPRCTNCHTGPIHEVHKGKVETESCSYCHNNIQGKHNSILGDSICEHCHKELIAIHGGEIDACIKCHGVISKITKPAISSGMTIVCENCHQADSIATIHGSNDDPQTCYRCHREGVDKNQSVKIPHIIHVPKVDCMTCHWDLNEDNIIVPKCSKCHEIDRIHAISTVGKGMRESIDCSICHPLLAIQQSMGELTEIPGKLNKAQEDSAEAPTSTPPIPGFGLLTSITALCVIYMLRVRK
ncbi:MAG: hypothetical protein E4G94_09165 [ANME-2 cluster archaeon]|nr:MAG: hypothetical protein E4G94_09165 [ANME-2 cluster archaeon]